MSSHRPGADSTASSTFMEKQDSGELRITLAIVSQKAASATGSSWTCEFHANMGFLVKSQAGIKPVDVMWKLYGKKKAFRHPTILISASDADDSTWWDDLLSELEAKLPHNFRVEVQHLAALRMATGDSYQ